MDYQVWNFNSNIARPLELIAREILKKDDLTIKDTIFCAPNICGGTFVEAMYELLHAMENYIDSNAFRTFVHQIELYWGKGYTEIPKEIATQLFESFEEILYPQNTNRGNE